MLLLQEMKSETLITAHSPPPPPHLPTALNMPSKLKGAHLEAHSEEVTNDYLPGVTMIEK